MRIPRPAPRPASDPIVALIDVVFFLLVFFMLIGRMEATAPFPLDPPTGQGAAPLPSGGVTLALAPDGRLALDGAAMTPEAALARLRDRLAAEPDLFIRAQADGRASLRDLLPLIAALEAAGARDVALAITPPPGAP